MEGKKSIGWEVLERAKAKEKIRHDWFFKKYSESAFWQYPEWRETAIVLLDSGIFLQGGLIGHKRHELYPVDDLGWLVFDIVQIVLKNTANPRLLKKQITHDFDEYFGIVANMARFAGVQERTIQKTWQSWRQKVEEKAGQEEVSKNWWSLLQTGKPAFDVASELTDIFLRNAPEAPSARIAKWVLAIIKLFNLSSISDRSLRSYITKKRSVTMHPITLTE